MFYYLHGSIKDGKLKSEGREFKLIGEKDHPIPSFYILSYLGNKEFAAILRSQHPLYLPITKEEQPDTGVYIHMRAFVKEITTRGVIVLSNGLKLRNKIDDVEIGKEYTILCRIGDSTNQLWLLARKEVITV